ncbi:MAG: Non-ribosomal peptide synthase [Myxococcales bacterium]|nr:Non-ribosomal peptide synthase [Myxococcales bacterium]
MKPEVIESSYGLTPVQLGMLFSRAHAAGSGVDIEQMTATLREPLDVANLRRAWQVVVAQHGALRTRFRWDGLAAPVQEVLVQVELPLLETDLRGLSAAQQTSALDAFLREDRVRGIDLAHAPLFRLHVFQLAAEESRLVWTFPHILLDGGSFPAVVTDVFAAYEALGRGETPTLGRPRPYGDHIAWLEQEIARTAGDASTFFRERLAGFEAKNVLAADAPNASAVDERSPRLYGELDQRLSLAETERLRGLAREHGLTLNTFVQAAWSLVVADFSGGRDVVFGVVRACRRSALPEAEKMVGLFINTLPLRVRVAAEQPVLEWLRDIRAAYVAQRPFEHTPLQAVQAVSEVPKGTSLFDSIIVYNDALMDSTMRAQGGGFARRAFSWIEQTNFPVTLFGYGEPELLLKISYDKTLVSDAIASSMLARALAALSSFAAQADRRLGELARVPAHEVQALAAWNQTKLEVADVKAGLCVHQLFEQQAARTPDALALVFRGQSLSYRDLNHRANQVAHRLVALGVGPDALVGIYVQRSLEMVVGLLGILKAGGAYVPLDPNYPPERIAMMLEDSRAPVIVTESRLARALPKHAATLLVLDKDLPAPAATPNVASAVTSRNLAYVIFTSGSTGRPKGVMVEHRNVLNFFAGMDERIGRDAGTWLAVTSISFDISVLELFWTLARGFRVVIQEEGDKSSLTKRTEPARSGKHIDFSLFYFAADAGEVGQNRYRLLLEGARYADTHGFLAIWTPERHFHEFGGLYPNPSITSAAVATITERVQLRAGSVVLPLHNPIRVAEEWSVVDNLSNGRVGLSFASGWHANDFALMPENYAARKDVTSKGIETVKKLWRGEAVPAKSGNGADIMVKILPRPIQANPPIWVTAAGNVETFRFAGESGANVLTNMLGQSVEDLKSKVTAYRAARREHGHEGEGHVTLMLHTFVGTDVAQVKELVRKPFTAYLKTSTDLVKKARWEFPAFARPARDDGSAAPAVAERELTSEEEDALMAHAFERYFETHGLFGTPESCLAMIDGLKGIGVDEVACLVDFGVASDTVLANLDSLNRLRELSAGGAAVDEPGDYGSIAAQIRRHGVTHLQCTPSLARMLLEDAEAASALGSLRRLMVGGEALPAALAEPLSRRLAGGALLNMYGPTETTVWSTTEKIEPGVPVTIGRPIANTQIYLLDRALQPTPLGVAGELCIGGDGVVRGYLQRPDLTRDRFVADPFVDPSGGGDARYYRTGDLARFLPDGRIEFLGRLDHQVKVRGYRIELAEIEAALAKHPAVGQSVVVAREDNAGDQRIVAYVVAKGRGEAGAGATEGARSAWQNIWDEAYRAPLPEKAASDATFNVAGWNSSYTGEAIPEAEMRDWVLNTTQNLRALGARRILEIGCGTGLLLFRVAPECERYTGVDFSQAALDHIQATLAKHPLPGVELMRANADDFEVAPGAYDAVVINSVAQYFPSADYLARVLERALRALAPGGKLFVGDVRSLPWLEAFHASIELGAAPDAASCDELAEAVQRRLRRESELVIAPELFRAFAAQHRRVRSVRAELKRARFSNELTNYRYDVVLATTGPGDPVELGSSDVVELDGRTVKDVASLSAALAAAPVALRVRGLKNPRVARELEAIDLLNAHATKTVGELRAALAASTDDAVSPEALASLNAAYDVQLTESDDARRFDAVFVHRERAAGRVVPTDALVVPPKPWDAYVHRAATPGSDAELIAELRAVLRETLPDFMVPSHFVTLAALPLTPNGKIDRKALPAPEVSRSTSALPFSPASNELERQIAAVWQQILHVEQVGIHDNFFDLGANSLLIMQANGALRASLGRPVSLIEMFQNPTVASLAAHLGAGEAGAAAAASAGQDRALNRRDAMQKRREQLASARQPPKR